MFKKVDKPQKSKQKTIYPGLAMYFLWDSFCLFRCLLYRENDMIMWIFAYCPLSYRPVRKPFRVSSEVVIIVHLVDDRSGSRLLHFLLHRADEAQQSQNRGSFMSWTTMSFMCA